MNILNIIAKIYSHLHNYKGVPYWALTPFRRMVRGVANKVLPCYLGKKHQHDGILQENLVVSFTSFPARIGNVWQVVECMLRQTYKPEKILLWLSKEQFKEETSIPIKLRKMQGDVFEIRMVDGDIRSHKKYVYAFKEYRDKLVVLIDDDIYYPTDMIENLCKEYRQHPKAVVCRYANIMQYNEKGELKSYLSFTDSEKIRESSDYFFGTGGGTLIPPSLLYEDACREDLFLKLTPLADDVWINAMVRLANLDIRKIKSGLFLPVKNKGTFTLSLINNGENKNDEQLKAVSNYYMTKIQTDPFRKMK